ncbi:MAG TPA: hypothetical protein VFY29_14400 [Terriglobia bacterium]|nr:hypothetical protein [Terriglobia bacterium]
MGTIYVAAKEGDAGQRSKIADALRALERGALFADVARRYSESGAAVDGLPGLVPVSDIRRAAVY